MSNNVFFNPSLALGDATLSVDMLWLRLGGCLFRGFESAACILVHALFAFVSENICAPSLFISGRRYKGVFQAE